MNWCREFTWNNGIIYCIDKSSPVYAFLSFILPIYFQDDFVLDNASLQNYLPQFSLHKPSLCEVAVALGPSWDRCSANQRLFKGENSSVSSPLLLPAYLNLIAIVEADQNGGNLDS